MSIRLRVSVAVLIVLTLLVGCGKDELPVQSSTPTVAPATATVTPPMVTHVPPATTPIPPTETAAPTPTTVPPTPTASPPVVSSSGEGLIAFVSTRDGNGEIYVMNADGSDQRRLTNYRQWDSYPAWSPDGEHIAYYSYLGDKEWVIKVMGADGGNPKP